MNPRTQFDSTVPVFVHMIGNLYFLHLDSYLCLCFVCIFIFFCVYLCVCAYILVDELISPKDIDPIHRYVPRQDQRNVSMRYSNQVSFNVTVIDCHHLAHA